MKTQLPILLIALFALFQNNAQAQVAVTNSVGTVTSGAQSVSQYFEVPAGSDRLLMVAAGSEQTHDNVTFDGTNMTQITTQGVSSLWYMVLGTSATITSGVVEFTTDPGAPAPDYIGINITSYSGVDQTTPTGNTQQVNIPANATTSILTVNGGIGDLIYDALIVGCWAYLGCFNPTGAFAGTGQTIQNNISQVGAILTGRGVTSTKAGFPASNMSWTFTGNTDAGGDHIAVNIKKAPSLPIELASFTARQKNNDVLLEWETIRETNNAGFELQRSRDGRRFEKIAWLVGQGTTNVPHLYRYTDQSPPARQLYFRLKQRDTDGGASFSKVEAVMLNTHHVLIYPNPGADHLYLETTLDSDAEILIIDHLGRLHLQLRLEEHQREIDISALPSGIFTIEINNGNQLFLEQLIKL